MMPRHFRLALPALALALAACQQAQLALPAAPAGPALAVANLGEGDRVATLLLSAPAPAYALQAVPTVHRWVPADIVRYDVELKLRNATTATQFDSLATPLVLQVPVGANATGQASFGQLRAGAYYRAVVKAMGRRGGSQGSDAIQALNTAATDDFADFDFTASNDIQSQVQKSVTIDFDAVAFNGLGSVSFGSPSPGVYVNPSHEPTGAVVSPSPLN